MTGKRSSRLETVWCRDPWEYAVLRDPLTGQLYIEVIANISAFYFGVRVRLTREETARFRGRKTALIGLANRICASPKRFGARCVPCD